LRSLLISFTVSLRASSMASFSISLNSFMLYPFPPSLRTTFFESTCRLPSIVVIFG
jgi:hypothetical protein